MNDSIGKNNSLDEKDNNNISNISMQHNQKLVSLLKHFLDYLPITLVKLIFDKNIINDEKALPPLEYKSNSCFLYIDITVEKNNYIINKKNFNKEIYEYVYSYINKNLEELASAFIEYGCDIIFYGTGLYAFIIPDFNEEIIIESDNTKTLNKILKMLQIALEIKNDFFESKKNFKIKLGLSYGECKLIVLDNKIKSHRSNNDFRKYSQSFRSIDFIMSEKSNIHISNKNLLYTNGGNKQYYYFFFGKPLIESCEYAKRGNEGQIIIDQIINNYITENFEVEELEGKLPKKLFKVIKSNQLQKLQNRLLFNSKIIYSDRQIISKKDIILNFSPNFIFKAISEKGYLLNGKWIKETKYMTILMMRPLIRSQDLNGLLKINQLIKTINELISELGGLIFRIMCDEKGLLIMILFGLKNFESRNKDELISVIFGFEITKRLKEINIFPHIGISSDVIHINLNKYSGGRKDFSIIGESYIIALQCLRESEKMYGGKMIGTEAIIIDKNTMDMIDSSIPCRFFKKLKINNIKKEIFLFSPVRFSKIYNINKDDNIIPLLSSHLHYIDKNIDITEEELKIIDDKKYLNFHDRNQILHFVDLLINFLQDNIKVKLVNINGLSGSGKTLFLSESLNIFFRHYPMLKDIIIYKNIENDYQFLFISNLEIINYAKKFNSYSKKEFKAIQHILCEIYNYLCDEINEKNKIMKLIKKNHCLEYLSFLEFFFEDQDLKNNFDLNDLDDKTNLTFFNEDDKNNLFSLFIDIITEYNKYINKINEKKINQYNIKIPIIIVIDSINICDKYSLDFIKYYLNKDIDSNDLLIITTNSIPIYPQYMYQKKNAINPFYKFTKNPFLYQYEISTLNSKEKMESFVISLINSKTDLLIEDISEKITYFLIFKTYGGIQEQVIKLILYLYENNYIYAKKINQKLTLVENQKFELMIKQNDFIDLIIPYSIEKNIYYIIERALNIEEIALLNICSVLGDLFDTVKLSHVLRNNSYSFINSFNDYWKKVNNNSLKEIDLYENILELEEKNVIEILSDIDANHQFVVCKFSIPFMREILYQCSSLDQKNELHYIIGKIMKNKVDLKGDYIFYKYYSDEFELLNLKKHLRKMEIFMHDYNMKKNNIFEENDINYIVDESFTLNNLKTIIIHEIRNKLSNSKYNNNTMIKCGYAEKKSDGKITWEKRFFVLTTNKLSYYYIEDDYKLNKEPLAFFYLKNLYDIKVLRNNNKYIFCLTVNEWIKKKELMDARIYVLSTEKWEDLYSWTLSLKIMKIKAFYDSFCNNYCFVYFPLFQTKEKEKSELSEFKLNIDNYINIHKNILTNDYIKRSGLKERVNGRRLSIISNILGLDLKETDYLRKRTNHLFIEIVYNYFRFILRYSLTTLLNNIQIKIKKDITIFNRSNTYDFIEASFLKEKYHIKMNTILSRISFNNENLKMKIDEEKRSIYYYSFENNNNISEKYLNYLKCYYPIKTYGDSISYKKKDLKKIIGFNHIVTSKDYEEIDFIDEQEEKPKNEDNLRFGDYTDITSPYPLTKLSSNNNFIVNDNNDENSNNRKSAVLQHKGEKKTIFNNENNNNNILKTDSRQKINNNVSPFLPSFNINNQENNTNQEKDTNQEKNSSEYFNNINQSNHSNLTKSQKDNKEILRKNHTIKSYHSHISKERNLESIKEEIDYFKSKKNKSSFSSSSLNSSEGNFGKKMEVSENKITGEKTLINMENSHVNYNNFINNNNNNDKDSNKNNSELTNNKEEAFNFGQLLRSYTNSINLKKIKSIKSIKDNEIKKENISKKWTKEKEGEKEQKKIKQKKEKEKEKEEKNPKKAKEDKKDKEEKKEKNEKQRKNLLKLKRKSIGKETKDENHKQNNNKVKFTFNEKKMKKIDKKSLENIIKDNYLEKHSSNKSLYSDISNSSTNKENNDIKSKKSKISNRTSNSNKNSYNSNTKSNKSKSNNSKKNSQNNEIKISYNSKNSSFKNLIVKNSNNEKKYPDINLESLNTEEEPSTGKINCSMTQLSTIKNILLNNKSSNTERNNYSLYKKDKKGYNPFLISFFSKTNNVKTNQISNISSTDRTNSTSEKNEQSFSKINKNLKLWLLLNKNNEPKNNINKISLNKSEINESSSRDIMDSLNESYSYIKNFFFDNYRDTKKRCQLKKKVLVELKSKNINTTKKYEKNNNLDMFEKLKNKSISLDQEKEYLGYFKDIINQNKQKKINENNKISIINTSRSKSSNNYENSTSNNTYREKFYYPNVFYLNKNENLHKKTHVSHLFSKLKANNKFK